MTGDARLEFLRNSKKCTWNAWALSARASRLSTYATNATTYQQMQCNSMPFLHCISRCTKRQVRSHAGQNLMFRKSKYNTSLQRSNWELLIGVKFKPNGPVLWPGKGAKMTIFQQVLHSCSGHFRLKILAWHQLFLAFFGQDKRITGACHSLPGSSWFLMALLVYNPSERERRSDERGARSPASHSDRRGLFVSCEMSRGSSYGSFKNACYKPVVSLHNRQH